MRGGVGFRRFKGLRQGDPLSPLLFNVVADAFSNFLTAASREGVLEGLVPHLKEGGLTHLRYADDTIIFLDNSETNFEILKFLLLCYESMSGMKINYSKSAVFAIGIEQDELVRIAAVFGCKVGPFPIL